MKSTLTDLVRAIQGTVVMSLSLEAMFNSFLLKRVPENWEKVAYPSLKPLASWVPDLVARV
jgi:dynein heavy chain